MGTEAAWVPAVVAALGAGASYVNTTRTANRQDEIAARNLRNQASRQRDADAKTRDLVMKTGQSNPDEAKKNMLGQFMQQISANAGQAQGGLINTSGASQEYRKDAQDAALGIKDYGARTADLISRIDAPRAQRRNEANMAANYGSEIDRIRRFSQGDDFLSRLAIQNTRRNPWLDAFSGIASGYASAYGGGTGTGAGASGGGYTGDINIGDIVPYTA